MTIYADEVFAINTVSNILLLYSYCLLYRIHAKRARLLAAAVLGGLYAVFDAVLEPMWLARTAVLAVMAVLAFGKKGTAAHTLKLMFISVCVEAVTLTGIVIVGGSAVISGAIIAFANGKIAAAIYLISYPTVIAIRYIMRKKQKYRRVTIVYNNREIEFFALRDSGNLLRYNGKSVITVEWRTARELFEYEDYSELELNSAAFIVYNTLSGGGILPVFENVKCYINGISADSVMAVTDRGFSGKYRGIIA